VISWLSIIKKSEKAILLGGLNKEGGQQQSPKMRRAQGSIFFNSGRNSQAPSNTPQAGN